MIRRPLSLTAALGLLAAAAAALGSLAAGPAYAAPAARLFEVDPLHSSVRFGVPYELIVLGEVQGQRFPTITFESTRIEPGADGHRLVGTLRLRGVDQEVTVPFRLVEVGDSLVVSGTVWLERSAFGIGSPAELAAGVFRLGERVSVSLNLLLAPAE